VDGLDKLSISRPLSTFSTVGPYGPGHPGFLQIEVGMDGRAGRAGPSDPLKIRRIIIGWFLASWMAWISGPGKMTVHPFGS